MSSSLDEVFRPREQRRVFSFGIDRRPDPFDEVANQTARGQPCGVRPRASANDFGGSLDEVLASGPRRTAGASGPSEALSTAASSIPCDDSVHQTEDGLPCGVRPRASADDFGGSLDEVLASRPRRVGATTPPEPQLPAPTAHAGRSAEDPGLRRRQVEDSARLMARMARPMAQAQAPEHAQVAPAALAPLAAPAGEASVPPQHMHEVEHREEQHEEQTGVTADDRMAADGALAQQLQTELWTLPEQSLPPRAPVDSGTEPSVGSTQRTDATETEQSRRLRPSAPTAAEWGGGLGDILPRHSDRGRSSSSHRSGSHDREQHTRHTPSSRSQPSTLAERMHAEDWLNEPLVDRRWPIAAIARAVQAEQSAGARGVSPPQYAYRVADFPIDAAAGAAVTYEELMQAHLRDNRRARDPDAWRRVIKLFKPVRTRTVSKPLTSAGGEAGEEAEACSICLDPLVRTGSKLQVCALPCAHQFHTKCITECVKQGHGCCPNCRYDLIEKQPAAAS